MSRLRIALIAAHFAEYTTRLARALSEHGDVQLLLNHENQRAECEGLGLESWRPNSISVTSPNVAKRWITLNAIIRAVKHFNPHVVHVQEQGDALTTSLVQRLSRFFPIVLTVHDPVPHSGKDALIAQMYASNLAKLRNLAKAYHVHGAFCESALRRAQEITGPILSTAHGVLLCPTGMQLVPQERRLLFFGRMERYKGLDILLDAFDMLPEARRPTLVVAGQGPELMRLRREIAARKSIEVIDGFLKPVDAIAQFQRAEIVLVPYRDASQSGVVSSAFGNGRPVIASRVGSLAEAVTEGESGLMVPPGDPSALAAAINAALDRNELARLTRGAELAAKGPFAWSRLAEELMPLYEAVLAPGRSATDKLPVSCFE